MPPSLLLLAAVAGAVAATADAANISYDGRALLVDGERRLLAAGSIHYARSTPEMWPALMASAKEAGIDVITTYVFWNLHEAEPHNDATGEFTYDFATGRRNLTGFLAAAHAAGLYVFVRLGPFACAEWTYGGIPTRLRALSSNYSSEDYSSAPRVTFRSWDPVWRTEMAAFVTRVVEEIRPQLATNGGPVVMLQPENEYGNIEQYYVSAAADRVTVLTAHYLQAPPAQQTPPEKLIQCPQNSLGSVDSRPPHKLDTALVWLQGPDGKKYAQWAANLVLGLDTGVPVAMCEQSGVNGVIESCNGFYCDPHDAVAAGKRAYPSFFTEAWAGWFAAPGTSLGHRPASDLAFSIAKFVAEGGTLWNYYMLQGGTNFGRTAGEGVATSYDYNAPISEWGFPRQPKYGLLQKLHATLHQFEAAIVGVDTPPNWWEQGVAGMPGLSSHVYSDAVGFLVNANHSTDFTLQYNCSSSEQVTVKVPHWSVSIVDHASCEVLFDSSASPGTAPPPAPSEGLAGAPSTSWLYWVESTNLDWCEGTVSSGLPEQIDATGGPLSTDYMCAAVELTLPVRSHAGASLMAMEQPMVGGPMGGVHRVDGFVDGAHFAVAPNYPSALPRPVLSLDASGATLTDSSVPPSSRVVMTLRMSVSGLPNYLWSNKLCKKEQCNGNWDPHLENFDRGLLGPILLSAVSESGTSSHSSSSVVLLANLTRASWKVCTGLHGEALNLSSPAASDPPGGWRTGTAPLSDTGTWVRLRLALPAGAGAGDGAAAGIGLNLTGMSSGEAWVNGHSIGRYTLARVSPTEPDCKVCNRTGPYDPNGECHFRCGEEAEPLYHVPRSWLLGRTRPSTADSPAAAGKQETEGGALETVVLWERESGADPSRVAFVTVRAE